MQSIAIGLFILGFAIEALAVIAIVWYPLRRILPFKSPFELQSYGCMCFYIGVVFSDRDILFCVMGRGSSNLLLGRISSPNLI